jgi:hypothetical protein
MHFVIRAEGDPAALVQSVRRELHRMAPAGWPTSTPSIRS